MSKLINNLHAQITVWRTWSNKQCTRINVFDGLKCSRHQNGVILNHGLGCVVKRKPPISRNANFQFIVSTVNQNGRMISDAQNLKQNVWIKSC